MQLHPGKRVRPLGKRKRRTRLQGEYGKLRQAMMDARVDQINKKRYERIIDRYLRECYSKRTPARATQVAAKLHANRQYISTTIARLFGKPLKSILIEKQVAYAAKLLASSKLSLTWICAMSGFGHRSTFFRLFEREMGMTPDAYRQENSVYKDGMPSLEEPGGVVK
jgi:two-component system response regulator YesN